jgi:WD40 repeat protein
MTDPLTQPHTQPTHLRTNAALSADRGAQVLDPLTALGVARAPADSFDHHLGPIAAVVDLGDGRAVTAGYDGAVGSFDLATGAATLWGHHNHLVTSLAADLERGLVATGSADYTVTVWLSDTQRRKRTLRGHVDDVEALTFLPDGRLVSGGRDGRVLIHDVTGLAPTVDLATSPQAVLALAAGDGLLVASGDDKTLRVWRTSDLVELASYGPFEAETDCCSIEPALGLVALGADDGVVHVLDLSTGEMREIQAHDGAVKAVVLTPAGRVVSMAYDGVITEHDARSGQRLATVAAPVGLWARSLRARPGGGLIGGTFDGTVILFDGVLASPLEIGVTGGNPCLNDIASARGVNPLVATAADDGRVRLFRAVPGRGLTPDGSLESPRRVLTNSVAVTDDGGQVAAGSHDGRLLLWDTAGARRSEPLELPLGHGPINSIAVLGTSLLVATYDGHVVEVVTGNDQLRVRHETSAHDGAVKVVRSSDDGTRVVTGAADGTLQTWRRGDDGLLRRDVAIRTGGEIVNDVALSPDGRCAAVVGRDFQVTLYVEGIVRWSRKLGRWSLRSVAIAADGDVVAGDYWGRITLLALATGDVVSRTTVATNGISGLASLDNGMVLSSSYDGTITDVSGAPRALVRLMDQRPVRSPRAGL